MILGAYTVYLDLWLCDLDGNVLANGRADRFRVAGQNVANTKWFREARGLALAATTMSPAMSSASRCSGDEARRFDDSRAGSR